MHDRYGRAAGASPRIRLRRITGLAPGALTGPSRRAGIGVLLDALIIERAPLLFLLMLNSPPPPLSDRFADGVIGRATCEEGRRIRRPHCSAIQTFLVTSSTKPIPGTCEEVVRT